MGCSSSNATIPEKEKVDKIDEIIVGDFRYVLTTTFVGKHETCNKLEKINTSTGKLHKINFNEGIDFFNDLYKLKNTPDSQVLQEADT